MTKLRAAGFPLNEGVKKSTF